MLNRKQQEIDRLNGRCIELAQIVYKKNVDLKYSKHNNELIIEENLAVYEENKELRNENEELTDLFKRITKIIESNKYNNEKSVMNKIKELILDFDSQN